jgi:hypothetical protein
MSSGDEPKDLARKAWDGDRRKNSWTVTWSSNTTNKPVAKSTWRRGFKSFPTSTGGGWRITELCVREERTGYCKTVRLDAIPIGEKNDRPWSPETGREKSNTARHWYGVFLWSLEPTKYFLMTIHNKQYMKRYQASIVQDTVVASPPPGVTYRSVSSSRWVYLYCLSSYSSDF